MSPAIDNDGSRNKNRTLDRVLPNNGEAVNAGSRPVSPFTDKSAAPRPMSPALQLKVGSQGKMGIRKRLGLLLDNPKSGMGAKVMISINVFMIVLSVFNFFLDTIPARRGTTLVRVIEMVGTVFFTTEVVTRTFIATQDLYKMMLLEPLFWIDVVTLMPNYGEIILRAVEGVDHEGNPTTLNVVMELSG